MRRCPQTILICVVWALVSWLPVVSGAGDGGPLTFEVSGSGLPAEGTFTYVIAGDLNGDGHRDIAAPAYDGRGIHVFLGDGDGGFTQASQGLPDSGGFGQMASGDLDGDGLADLVAMGTSWAGNRGVHVYLQVPQEGSTSWEETTSPDPDGAYNGAAIAGDVVVGAGKTGMRSWRWRGGHWEKVIAGLPQTGEFTGVDAVPLGDGVLAAFGSYSMDGVAVLRMNSTGWHDVTPVSVMAETTAAQAQHPVLADVDGDGLTDLAASFGGSGTSVQGIRFWKGVAEPGDGEWLAPASEGLPARDWFFQLSFADIFDGAAGLELAAGSGKGNDGQHVWTMVDGEWLELDTDLPDEGNYYGTAVADMNDDGAHDLVCAPMDEGLEVYMGDVNGTPVDADGGADDGDGGDDDGGSAGVEETVGAGACIVVMAALGYTRWRVGGRRRR